MRSCLTMSPEVDYEEAKRLLKEKYGQNYNIATAYVNRITSAAPIKSEDKVALQSYSVLLVSCRNALKEIGYRSKIENTDILLKIIEKLPFSLRQRWKVADDITYNKSREIMFDDVVKFVESKTRVLNHPIFGKLTSDNRNKHKETPGSKYRQHFGIDGRLDQQETNRRCGVNARKSYRNAHYVVVTIFCRGAVNFRGNLLMEERRLFVNVDCATIVCWLVTW